MAMCESMVQGPGQEGFSYGFEEDDDDHARFNQAAVEEIERYRRMDEWISSYQNIYSSMRTVPGATAALREQLGENETLKGALWEAVT